MIYNWTGLYVGLNGGYGWGRQDPLNLLSHQFDRADFNINGGMIGGTIGEAPTKSNTSTWHSSP